MPDLIQPRTLKGFRDYLPALMIPREWLMDTARRVYRSYGFSPIDTPALEYAEILIGKMDAEAEIQRQLYRFADKGGRDVALRFDLTVPFARFAAQHINQLGIPFKRYHVGPVWRGENPQAGRYREFIQADVDIIGTTSNAADIEIALVINDLMAALGFERFEIRVNNRLVLNGLLEELGLAAHAHAVLRILDKLGKQGREAVLGELTAPPASRGAGLSADQANRVLTLAGMNGDQRRDSRVHRKGFWPQRQGSRRHRPIARTACRGPDGGHSRRPIANRPGDLPRPRLLHRRDLRDVPDRPARHRLGLLRRPLRQSRGPVHQASVARRRRLAGPGPFARRDGRTQPIAEGDHAGAGADRAILG